MMSSETQNLTGRNGVDTYMRDVSMIFPAPSGGEPVVALDNVSMDVKRGEFLVLVGRSGSGKTTALNALAGLNSITSGELAVLGETPIEARSRMGYMFARDALLGWRTAKKNVEFGLEIRGVTRAVRDELSERFLGMVNMLPWKDNLPTQLSQGQRQRVALARTWALSPDLLLMDEPFAAVDAQTRESLHHEFLKLWEEERRTVIFVTHDLNEAITLADRILVFSNGKIVEECTVDLERPRNMLEIGSDPDTRRLYRHLHSLLA